MYSIELPTKEVLEDEREALRQMLSALPEQQRGSLADHILFIHQKFSEELHKIQDLATTLERLDANALRNADLNTEEEVRSYRDTINEKIVQFKQLIQIINELMKITISIYEITNLFYYIPPNQRQNIDKITRRLTDFEKAIKEDLPELKKIVEEKLMPYLNLEYKLSLRIEYGPARPDDGITGARIISGSSREHTQLKQMAQQEIAYSPNFKRFLRGVASVIAVVTLWFAGDSGRGTMADIDTPMPAASAAASPSPYASPSATERKVDFSRMPTSQFVEISTLPTGQIMVQNKEGKTLTLNNIGGNKWISSDGNQYISFKYPYGTKNFFTPVRTSTTAKPNPSPSAASPLPSASASPYASPTASPSESPRATSSSGAPEFDFTKETPGTLKFYIEDSDGITAIGYDGNGAILKPIKEFGPGVFRSAGGKLYNKKISQKSIIFVPR